MLQPNNDPFTPSEVRTLIEEFRGDLRLFGERLLTVQEDVAILKDDVKDLKLRMITVEDVVRLAIPDLYAQVKELQNSRKN